MDENEEKDTIKNHKNSMNIIIGIILTFFVLVLILMLALGNNNIIYRGITVNGIKIGGLTKSEAYKVLDEQYCNLGNIEIYLYSDNDEIKFLAKDINAKFDVDKVAEDVFNTGRDGNFIEKFLSRIKYSFSRYDMEYDISVDVKKLDKQIALITSEFGNEVIQPSYVRQGDKLIVNTGMTGVKIDHAAIRQSVVSKLNFLESPRVEIKTIKVKPENVDIDKIQNSIKKNVQNAEYISDTGILVDQIIGIEIKDLDEAKKIAESITEEGMQFSIPLKITLPETTIDSVMDELFKDKLSTFTTTFNVNEKERTENVKLAAQSINDVILMPGQEFSYNNILGERSTERGYKIAKVYQDGQVIDGLGGGICQVSSTLYNAVVKADLEVLERRNHSLSVAYVRLGTDATVSYGSVDFRFRNNQQYPIKIESSVSGSSLTISICGIKTQPNRTVDIETETIAVLDFAEKTIEDPTLPMGTSKIIQVGKKGYKVKSYRVTKENNIEVERKVISTDTYSPTAQIKKVALTEVGI